MNPIRARMIVLHGPDAGRFCNAQFSSRVLALGPGDWHWSAWLSPQGRVRASFPLCAEAEDRFVALVPEASAEPLARALNAFVLRLKLAIETPERPLVWRLAAADVPEPRSGPGWIGDIDGHGLMLCWSDPLRGEPIAEDEVTGRLIRAGLPWLPAQISERYTGHMLGLDRLGALALDKGCYPGQEIVARTHYLGRSPRTLRALAGVAPAGLPQLPARLNDAASDDAVGELIAAVRGRDGLLSGLAVLRSEAAGPLRLEHDVRSELELLPRPEAGG